MLKGVHINICNYAIGIKIARSKLNHLNIIINLYEICFQVEIFSDLSLIIHVQ